MSWQLTSSAFGEGHTIPTAHTGDGEDLSPPLAWSEPPAGTACFALVCDDPDAPRGTWVHWVIFNLPGELRSLEAGVAAAGAIEGKNDFGNLGYGGPAPPSVRAKSGCRSRPRPAAAFQWSAASSMIASRRTVCGSNRAACRSAISLRAMGIEPGASTPIFTRRGEI